MVKFYIFLILFPSGQIAQVGEGYYKNKAECQHMMDNAAPAIMLLTGSNGKLICVKEKA